MPFRQMRLRDSISHMDFSSRSVVSTCSSHQNRLFRREHRVNHGRMLNLYWLRLPRLLRHRDTLLHRHIPLHHQLLRVTRIMTAFNTWLSCPPPGLYHLHYRRGLLLNKYVRSCYMRLSIQSGHRCSRAVLSRHQVLW